MLRRVRGNEILFEDWVVILLSPEILSADGVLFSATNAASGYASIAPGLKGLAALYAPVVNTRSGKYTRLNTMVEACPTDAQAEALIPRAISRSMITGVAVTSLEQAWKEEERLACLGGIRKVRWFIAPNIFDGSWIDMVKTGRRPKEVLAEF